MIGNDIVDLKLSPSNWERPRFLEKVFTEKEHTLISSSKNKHQMLWLLWSMKEAAYKCHVQQFGERFFNPKRLVCELISGVEGTVRIDNNEYYTDATITEDYIYTIANLRRRSIVISSVSETETQSYNAQSSALKQHFITSVSETRKIPSETLKIKKTVIGVPQLFNSSKQLAIPFSLTHCGRFSGFVYS